MSVSFSLVLSSWKLFSFTDPDMLGASMASHVAIWLRKRCAVKLSVLVNCLWAQHIPVA